MPDDDSADDTEPKEGDAEAKATSGPWSTGDVVRLGTVDSTNRYALEAAGSGRSGGFVVVCDHQSAGRGRRGRAWVEPSGGSLLCSVLFRPRLDLDRCGLLSFVVACSALDAIEMTTGVEGSLKWPNDVLIDDHKVAGVLAEVGVPTTARAGGSVGPETVVVVGIGVNLGFPPGWLDEATGDDDRPISERATTIEQATGIRPDRDAFLAAFLVGLDHRVGHEPDETFVPPLLEEVRRRTVTLGRAVQIEESTGTWTGLAIGINDRGRLEVERDGTVRVLDAADVVHLR